MVQQLKKLAHRAGQLRLPGNDVFWLAGAGLVASGAALERLSAGLIVAGVLLLIVAIGGERAR
jgi:hypothetical protein